jgi:4-hydroxy-tetrahydrodipicolinate synthase
MTHATAFQPAGVIPACLLPFHPDLSIDEPSLRSHLRDLAAIDGVTAIAINAHASEVSSCTLDEQRQVFSIAMDEVGDRMPLVHGVYAEGSFEAAHIARMAESLGASALLVFPPSCFTLGHTPAMVISHFRHIADASSLPLIAFEYPIATQQGYSLDTMLALIDAVPSVRAIKDWSGEGQAHERHVRALQSPERNVAVLSAHSAWLLSSLVLGCKGIVSGAGSVIADLQARMFDAVGRDDMVTARQVAERIHPLTEVFYTDPWVDMHNRMKEALVLLGKLPCAAVRPPLVKLGDAEIARIAAALRQAGLLTD